MQKMKTNHLSSFRTFFAGLLLFFLAPVSWSQIGTIDVEQLLSTSNTSNSVLTYQIVLSNGWQPGISTVTSLRLFNSAGTAVYTHPTSGGGSAINTGLITNLTPGYYYFSGTVSTQNTGGKFVSVSLYQEVYVGYKVFFDNCYDMEEGAGQYTLRRSKATTGQTYSYAQSFNQMTGAGWMEMSKLMTGSNSYVYWILEPISNLTTFSPSDNISYIEFFYINSTTNGIKLKYKQIGGTYTTTALSVSSTDRIRFVRNASNVCNLEKNDSSTSIFSFPVNITGTLKFTLAAKEIDDRADELSCSFGYPSGDFPFVPSFGNADVGTVTTGINPLISYSSPYNYVISDQPIEDMKKIYKYLKDSIYTSGIDSATFYQGATASTRYTSKDLLSGPCYVATFDSQGRRVYSNRTDFTAPYTTSSMSNVSNSYTEYLSTANGTSYSTLHQYISEGESGGLRYYISNMTDEYAFGLVNVGDNIDAGPATISKIRYGFHMSGGAMTLIVNGATYGSSFTPTPGLAYDIKIQDGKVYLLEDDHEHYSNDVTSGFAYKSGVIFKSWGTRVRIIPVKLMISPFKITTSISDNACGKNSGDLSVTFPTTGFLGGTVSGINFTLKNVTDETAPVTVATITANYSVNDLPVGVYSLEGQLTVGATVYSGLKRLLFVGSKCSWQHKTNLVQWPGGGANTNFAIANSSATIGNPAKAISLGKLNGYTAGWLAFTSRGGTNANTVLSLASAPQMNTYTSYFEVGTPLVFFYGGAAFIAKGSSGIVTLISPFSGYSPNIPVLITRSTTGTVKFRQNYTVNNTVTTFNFKRWKPAFNAKVPTIGVENVVSSFQCSEAATDTYAELKYTLDGYYHIMEGGEIRFLFNQEYDAANLTFNIYDDEDKLVRTQADFPAVVAAHGPNYITINVDDPYCLGKGLFYLEVINSKKEVLYLRFYNDFNGCIPEGEGQGGLGG